jgi:hypothetical protein
MAASASAAPADQAGYDERLASLHPASLGQLPAERRVMIVGPRGLRVRDVLKLRETGLGTIRHRRAHSCERRTVQEVRCRRARRPEEAGHPRRDHHGDDRGDDEARRPEARQRGTRSAARRAHRAQEADRRKASIGRHRRREERRNRSDQRRADGRPRELRQASRCNEAMREGAVPGVLRLQEHRGVVVPVPAIAFSLDGGRQQTVGDQARTLACGSARTMSSNAAPAASRSPDSGTATRARSTLRAPDRTFARNDTRPRSAKRRQVSGASG